MTESYKNFYDLFMVAQTPIAMRSHFNDPLEPIKTKLNEKLFAISIRHSAIVAENMCFFPTKF